MAANNFKEPELERKHIDKFKELPKLKEIIDEQSFKAGRIGGDTGRNIEVIERSYNGDDERMEAEEMKQVNRPMSDLNNDQKFADNDEVALQEGNCL